ncbi:MAG: chemotaxis protein CheW [Planctomycetota bacterium]
MPATAQPKTKTRKGVRQLATFSVGDLLLGVGIEHVREINRQMLVTKVPHAPPEVRGVINLRGEVATVIDLRSVLGLPTREDTKASRNMIVYSGGETVGLAVDEISDILTVEEGEVSSTPANVDGVDGRFFAGVLTRERSIVVILDIDEAVRGAVED